MNDFWNNSVQIGYYDKIFKDGIKKNRGIQANWHRVTFLKVSSHIEDHEFHLDYACGPGTFTGNFLKCKSICTDISDNQIDYANKNYGNKSEFIKFCDFNLNIYQEKFDTVTVLGLLEFIDNKSIIELINNLEKVLKPGGKIILTTPNYRGFMYFLELAVNKIGLIDYSHATVNRLNKETVKSVMGKTNFSDIKIDKFINFGIFSSFISFKFSDKVMNYIDKIFNNYFGYLLLIELKK